MPRAELLYSGPLDYASMIFYTLSWMKRDAPDAYERATDVWPTLIGLKGQRFRDELEKDVVRSVLYLYQVILTELQGVARSRGRYVQIAGHDFPTDPTRPGLWVVRLNVLKPETKEREQEKLLASA